MKSLFLKSLPKMYLYSNTFYYQQPVTNTIYINFILSIISLMCSYSTTAWTHGRKLFMYTALKSSNMSDCVCNLTSNMMKLYVHMLFLQRWRQNFKNNISQTLPPVSNRSSQKLLKRNRLKAPTQSHSNSEPF